MTIRHQIELDMVLLLVAASVGIVFAMYYNNKSKISSSFSVPVMQDFQKQLATPAPAPKVETSSQESPDGTKILTMTVTTKDTSKTYAFTTSDAANTNQQSIYSITLSGKESMSVPFNTWSPDNKYVFLIHNTTTGSEALVMKDNAQPFAEGEQYFNVTTLFTAKNTGNTYQETTGWASETLLIVNTTLQNGSKGSSYWFEVPSKAIIQLSTEF